MSEVSDAGDFMMADGEVPELLIGNSGDSVPLQRAEGKLRTGSRNSLLVGQIWRTLQVSCEVADEARHVSQADGGPTLLGLLVYRQERVRRVDVVGVRMQLLPKSD